MLCQACGLCCTGHLFIWVKLRPAELDPAETLGLRVFRDDPTQRGFGQPCLLWQEKCTIYTSKHYPKACQAYNCKLLKELSAETVTLPDALAVIEQARALIQELETILSIQPGENFRERLVSLIENPPAGEDNPLFMQKAGVLLQFYDEIFGVNDLLEKPSAPEI